SLALHDVNSRDVRVNSRRCTASTQALRSHSEKAVTKFVFKSAMAAAILAAAWAGAAQADEVASEQTDAPSKIVKYSDSEITTASGAEALYNRIHAAAWHVCTDMFPGNNGPSALEGLRCIDTLTGEAVKEVNSPRLTAIHEEREGYAPPG